MKFDFRIELDKLFSVGEDLSKDLLTAFELVKDYQLAIVHEANERNWTVEDALARISEMHVPAEPEPIIKQLESEKLLGPGKKSQKLDRLRRRHGWKGGKLEELTSKILEFNSQKIQSKVARMGREKMRLIVDSLSTKFERLSMPEVEELFPARSVFMRKAAEKGQLIADELRGELTKDLRNALYESGLLGRGSRVTQSAVKTLEKSLSGTMRRYVEKDPRVGMPANIASIAVTEVKSSVNEVKHAFARKVIDSNNLIATKVWIHNPRQSKSLKNIREHHREMMTRSKRQPVPFAEAFQLSNGVSMRHPHDPSAPAREIVSCHCDYDVIVRKRE